MIYKVHESLSKYLKNAPSDNHEKHLRALGLKGLESIQKESSHLFLLFFGIAEASPCMLTLIH
jgi:hypothetical protein